MEDLSSMITGLLNSPEGMEQLKTMATALMGEGAAQPASAGADQTAGISSGEIAGLMKMASLLKNTQQDHRTGLLLAIRPHLSQQRQKRVDDAVKILRLIQILPAVKEAGIL